MDYADQVAEVRSIADRFIQCWHGQDNERHADLWVQDFRVWNSAVGFWVHVDGDQVARMLVLERAAFAEDFPGLIDRGEIRAVWHDGFMAIRDLTYVNAKGATINVRQPHVLTVKSGRITHEEEYMNPPAGKVDDAGNLPRPELLSGPAYTRFVKVLMNYIRLVEGP